MHPTKEILEKFVHGLLEERDLEKEIGQHVAECEFCRKYCEQFGRFLESIDQASRSIIPGRADNHAEELFRQALSGKIIPLRPLVIESEKVITYLAADDAGRQEPRVQNLATLHSVDPEIVLRLVRDLDQNLDYLQVVSDDPTLAANVMIRLPEIDREFITDESGRAVFENLPPADWEKLKWQLKLPDAIFSLEPFEYDPERVESSTEMILETPGGDRLKIVLEDRTDGKQISLQLLELKGKSDFGTARVIISSESVSLTDNITPDRVVSLGTIDLHEKINIRFFL